MNEYPVQIELHDIMNLNLYTRWSQQACGFGELSLTVKRHGDTMAVWGDTETMGPNWCRKALHALADCIADALEKGVKGEGDARRLELPVTVPIPPEVLAHEAKIHRMLEKGEPE
jgi:hypothetical protein